MKEKQAAGEVWLKATYHFHVFHYRMPETAAIATVTPFVPSPLTLKMGMIASLLQIGDVKGVKKVAEHLHEIEIKIIPPKAAVSFKAFMGYRSPPAVESPQELDEIGSYYPKRPHMREYALFYGDLEVYVKLPTEIEEEGKKALRNLRYLGCKDSIVTCIGLTSEKPHHDIQSINKLREGTPGIVALLVDFKEGIEIEEISKLIPGSRDEKMYEKSHYTIPGKIITKGRAKIFMRNNKKR